MGAMVAVLIAGLVFLSAGAELLVRGGAALARRLGLTPLLVGLTIVAFGTSAPEMVVSVGATIGGRGDIAVGNVVGSNIFNIGFILGLAAIVRPLRIGWTLMKTDVPIMLAAAGLGAWMATFTVIPRLGGCALVLLLIAYTVFGVRVARRQVAAESGKERDEAASRPEGAVWRDICYIVGGLSLLVGGAHMLVKSSVSIARSVGVSEAVIGLTIVAAGTSLPELATSVVAAARKQSDISVGNIVGSNIFNMFGILGVSAAVSPLSAPGVSRFDLWVMIAFSAAVFPLFWTGRRLQRWEGAVLVFGYFFYLYMMWPTG